MPVPVRQRRAVVRTKSCLGPSGNSSGITSESSGEFASSGGPWYEFYTAVATAGGGQDGLWTAHDLENDHCVDGMPQLPAQQQPQQPQTHPIPGSAAARVQAQEGASANGGRGKSGGWGGGFGGLSQDEKARFYRRSSSSANAAATFTSNPLGYSSAGPSPRIPIVGGTRAGGASQKVNTLADGFGSASVLDTVSSDEASLAAAFGF